MIKFFNVFQAVYETRSFSQAAEQLYISQPTVSVQIQQLEQTLGTPLFTRNHHGVSPTAAADLLYQEGLVLTDRWQELVDQVQHATKPHVTCRIGVSNTIAATQLPPIIAELPQTALQEFDCQLLLMNSAGIVDELVAHNLEFGFIEQPLTASGIARRAFFTDQLVHAGDPKRPLWLLREAGSGVRHYTDRYLAQHNLTPKQVMVVNNNDIIVRLLTQGIGQTIVSQNVLPQQVAYQSLGPQFTRQFYFLSRPLPPTSPLNQLAQLLQDQLTTESPQQR
ncbi:LysR family transcriptional regulator [Furfurilactobacillus curtus]|uniref:LysR family transcriptional regulator n=1 Tax=Furfurilactobacillus curtus TaxID=1746200 RepID=A0ABQ5JT78_9LACO